MFTLFANNAELVEETTFSTALLDPRLRSWLPWGISGDDQWCGMVCPYIVEAYSHTPQQDDQDRQNHQCFRPSAWVRE